MRAHAVLPSVLTLTQVEESERPTLASTMPFLTANCRETYTFLYPDLNSIRTKLSALISRWIWELTVWNTSDFTDNGPDSRVGVELPSASGFYIPQEITHRLPVPLVNNVHWLGILVPSVPALSASGTHD
jgi:hypothetical protein